MNFEEWWKTLTTREQNQTTYESLRVAFEAGQIAAREACAKVCEEDESGRDGGGYFAELIRARVNK